MSFNQDSASRVPPPPLHNVLCVTRALSLSYRLIHCDSPSGSLWVVGGLCSPICAESQKAGGITSGLQLDSVLGGRVAPPRLRSTSNPHRQQVHPEYQMHVGFRMSLEDFRDASSRLVQQLDAFMDHLLVSQRAFHAALKEATQLNDAQTGMYQIDVGGVPFHTITKGWRDGGMLAAMSSDSFSDQHHTSFLDRDPTWFPLVLHFLRTGDVLLPEGTEGRSAVCREACYYSLDELHKAAQKRPERIIVIGERNSYNGLYGPMAYMMYRPLHGSWERMHVEPPAGWGPYCYYIAGDGFLLVVDPSTVDPWHQGSVHKFCPAERSWVMVSGFNPLTRRAGQSWAYHEDHLYGTAGTCLWSLDMSTGQWDAIPWGGAYIVCHPSLCVVGNQLFVVGGLKARSYVSHRDYWRATDSVEVYLISERRWVSVPNMPKQVCGATVVGLDGKLLVIGGVDIGGTIVSDVLEYNPAYREWKKLTRLRFARTECTVTVIGGDVVVMGGYNYGPISSVERYNSRLHRWEQMGSLTDRLRCSAAVVIRV